MVTLYKLDNKKKMRVWKITAYADGYEVQHGVLGGEMQEKFTEIFEGKVNREVDEQIDLEMTSQIKKKKDKGYVDDLEKAKEGPSNALGLPLPMLGKPLKDITLDTDSLYHIQYKYNGHRCLIVRKAGELIAYSKNGQRIESIDHILEELSWLYDGVILDGELYCHGEKINTISSWVRRNQDDSRKLQYVIYDTVAPVPFSKRMQYLEPRIRPLRRCLWAPTLSVYLHSIVLQDLLKSALDEGYEGLMLRKEGTPYETGKRSKSLVKVKQWITEEFVVTKIKESKDGWAILRCMVKEQDGIESTVDVSAPGTVEEKTEVLRRKDKYIGKLVQLQFAEYTQFGIPFHPVAVYWRDPE